MYFHAQAVIHGDWLGAPCVAPGLLLIHLAQGLYMRLACDQYGDDRAFITVVKSPMATEIQFCLLGPLMVRCGGVVVPLPPGKQRTVLAALLLNVGQVVTLGELAEILWGTSPPSSARVTTQNHVMRLRKTLGSAGSRISTQPRGYLIHADASELPRRSGCSACILVPTSSRTRPQP